MKKKQTRRAFTPEEDFHLTRLIEIYGAKQWDILAQNMEGRDARQCRERWKSFLSPDLVNGPWTAKEDLLLFELHDRLGPKWSAFKQFFPGRSDYNIKNRWKKFQRQNEMPALYIEKKLKSGNANVIKEEQHDEKPCVDEPKKEQFTHDDQLMIDDLLDKFELRADDCCFSWQLSD